MKDLDPGDCPGSDDGVERMLTDVLRARKIEQGRLEQMRATVDAEWRTAAEPDLRSGGARRSGRWVVYAAAASMAAAALLLWSERPAAPQPAIGSISRLSGAGMEVISPTSRRHVGSGDLLRVGDGFTAPAPMLVTLVRGGTLRIETGSSLAMTAVSEFSLGHGLIYVDVPQAAANPVRVLTAAGEIDHIGTQFEVMSDDRVVRIRVREGRIRFAGNTAPVVARSGTELLIAPGSPASSRSIATYGPDWQWTTVLTPDFDVEGRPLIAFLQWSSREMGRRLDFADSRSRELAERTVLHGSIRGKSPLDALTRVLLTTSLGFEYRGDSIWVHSVAARAPP